MIGANGAIGIYRRGRVSRIERHQYLGVGSLELSGWPLRKTIMNVKEEVNVV